MNKCLVYMTPIAVVGLLAGTASASAAAWGGSMARNIAALSADSTKEGPLVLVRGGRGGGGGGRGGGGYAGGGRGANAASHLRLVDVKSADALDDQLQRKNLLLVVDEIVDRRGSSKQTSLRYVLEATVPGSGEDPHAKLASGSQHHGRRRRSAGNAPIIDHFHPPQVDAKRPGELARIPARAGSVAPAASSRPAP